MRKENCGPGCENAELSPPSAEAPHRAEPEAPRRRAMTTKIARAEAESRLMQTETAVCLQGWVPAEKRNRSSQASSQSTTAPGRQRTLPRTNTLRSP